jgi:hypothetical protein
MLSVVEAFLGFFQENHYLMRLVALEVVEGADFNRAGSFKSESNNSS